jgi:iron(III) transport system permease protein
MAYLPLAVGLALVGLEGVEWQAVEAGVLLRPDGAVWRRVVLPLAAPALAAGAGLLFVLSLGDYSVPSLFGVSVYALEIFADFSASGEPARAMALGLPLLLIATVTAIALQSGLRHAAQAPGADRPAKVLHAPAWFRPVQGIALFFCLLQMVVLLGALGLAVGGPAQLVASVEAAGCEILYTAWLASLCAILVLPLALPAAEGLSRTGWCAHLWWLLATMPLAVPAPLVGIGLISLYNRPTWPDLYALGALPVLANLARFAPIAALVALAQARRLDHHLLDAGRLLQRRPWQTLFQVYLPLMAPGLMAGAALVFAFTAGELGTTLIVALPGSATLTMRIYNYLHYGASADVAGLCLVLAGCALLAGSAATVLLRRRSVSSRDP